MKFCIKNDLSIFEFHDSEFSFVSFDGSDLVISASMVNIRRGTPQNPSDNDMEIASTQITFKNFNSATYEPGRTWKTGEDGKSYPVGPLVIYSGQEGIDRILEELKCGMTVYNFEKVERGYSIGGCGVEPYFTIAFNFDDVTVCWDEYKKKAWYELHRKYKFDAILDTPNGNQEVQLIVSCHDEAVFVKGVREEPPIVNVGCKYNGKEYWGQGSDYLWVDAFVDLQRQLPENALLKCCLTCRYGNLCPVGDVVNEVYCTKDVLIAQKSDLYLYTEDNIEREKRVRKYCDLCTDYQPQTDSFYTYNDYSDLLKRD